MDTFFDHHVLDNLLVIKILSVVQRARTKIVYPPVEIQLSRGIFIKALATSVSRNAE